MDTVTRDDFYDHLDDVNAGMLAAGSARAVPMSHYVDREANALFFITAKGTDLVEATRTPAEATYILASGSGKIYARIHGHARCVTDPAHLEAFWNPIADAWFEGGKDDPDVQLIRVDLSEAEVWTTPSGPRFMYEIARAQLTGDEPDAGSHAQIRF